MLEPVESVAAEPLVTVVVPTYRRPAGLQRLLVGLLEQQAHFTWDVLIVENYPPEIEATEAIVATASSDPQWPAEVQIRVAIEPEAGAAAARNLGIAEARGQLIAMLDDDVVPRPGWLQQIVQPLLAGVRAESSIEMADVAGCGGRVVLDPLARRPRWWDEAGIGGYLTSHDLDDEIRLLTDEEIVVTANAAFRRDALLRVGGFDLALGPRAGRQLVADDAALSRALTRQGLPLVWVPAALVIHDLPESRLRVSWLLRRAWWQGRSDWLLDRADHQDRKFGGARVAFGQTWAWWRHEWSARRSEGIRRSPTLVHVACDIARASGTCWEAVRGMQGGSRNA